MPTAAAAPGAVTATELQQSIFNAPPSAAAFASLPPAPSHLPPPPANLPPIPGSLKPPAAADTQMEDARSPTTSVAGQKRRRDEEEEEEEEEGESDGDVAMEEDSDDD